MTLGSGQKQPHFRRALWLVLGVAAVVFWRAYGHVPIVDWRQTDTQAIARHMAEPGSSIFYPRIDWGGAGPGYVETEFQLYTWIVGRFLRWFGDVEWPGRLVSLLATLATTAVVFRGLARRYGDVAALIGSVVLLQSAGVLYTATSVQPEALCLLLFASAWFAWLGFEESGSHRALVAYGVLGAVAMLVKPTAGQLGVASFVLVLLRSRQRLRDPMLWLVWGLMVGALALHLWHARNVYLEYGNTFGVLSGGDSKLPRVQHLLQPGIYLAATRKFVLWGTGHVGALAIVIALALKREQRLLAALLAGNVLWTLLTLRYSSGQAGNHYHLLAALTAAHAAALVAQRAAENKRTKLWLAGFGLICACGLARAVRSYDSTHIDPWNAPAIAVGKALREVAQRDDLVVIRSVESNYDPFWRTPNNFQDPRVFYYSRTRGWPLSVDDFDPRSLATPAANGARFYVETASRAPAPSFDAWLAANATEVRRTAQGGRVYALERHAK